MIRAIKNGLPAWVVGIVAVTGLVTLGCRSAEPPPVITTRAYVQAVNMRDVQALMRLTDRRTNAWAEQAATRASDQIGGRRTIEPYEMLQIVGVDPRNVIAKAELVDQTSQAAQVRLQTVDGREHHVDLVYESGSWRVQIPLPANPKTP